MALVRVAGSRELVEFGPCFKVLKATSGTLIDGLILGENTIQNIDVQAKLHQRAPAPMDCPKSDGIAWVVNVACFGENQCLALVTHTVVSAGRYIDERDCILDRHTYVEPSENKH